MMMTISIEHNLMVKQTHDPMVSANKKRWSIGAGLSLTCGVGAMILGLILAAESYLGLVVESDRVAQLSVFMLIASLALLSLGAHGMDKVEK